MPLYAEAPDILLPLICGATFYQFLYCIIIVFPLADSSQQGDT